MKLAVTKEKRANETRVAATPETVKKLKALGFDVVVESGAGEKAHILDADFAAAGARIAPSAADALSGADIVFKVQRPGDDELALIKRGAMLVAILSPYGDRDSVAKYASAGIDAFAMEFMPR